jgi:hypothetical protein
MLKGILAISGQPGLYKLVAETKSRIIVESLTTGKRMPASASAKISTLEDIAVFTHSGDVPLKDIFRRIDTKEDGGQALDAKSPEKDVRKYFEELVPDYDQDKVYLSDIRKVIAWYNILQEKAMLDFSAIPEESQPENVEEEPKSE